MKPSRLGAGATLTTVILIVWLGACTNSNEACGAEGAKNGTCQVGPTCGSGSIEILISDPADMCPGSNAPGGENYICCAPTVDGGSAPSSGGYGTPDAGTAPAASDSGSATKG